MSDVEYLNKLHEAREKINELTGMAQTAEDYELLSHVYDLLDELLSPICTKCKAKAKKFITSPAQLYDPAMAEFPGGMRAFWSGEWYCPDCGSIVAIGDKWWEKVEPIRKGAQVSL